MLFIAKKDCFHNGRFYYEGEQVECNCKFCKEGKVSYFEPIQSPDKKEAPKEKKIKQEVKNEKVKSEEVKAEETSADNVSQETNTDEKTEEIQQKETTDEPNKEQVKQKAKGKQKIVITD